QNKRSGKAHTYRVRNRQARGQSRTHAEKQPESRILLNNSFGEFRLKAHFPVPPCHLTTSSIRRTRFLYLLLMSCGTCNCIRRLFLIGYSFTLSEHFILSAFYCL